MVETQWDKDSADGQLLDRIFRTAAVDGGMGSADPFSYSPTALRMMPSFSTFQKYSDTQFRKACERAATREVRRRNKARETPAPNGGNFHDPVVGKPSFSILLCYSLPTQLVHIASRLTFTIMSRSRGSNE